MDSQQLIIELNAFSPVIPLVSHKDITKFCESPPHRVQEHNNAEESLNWTLCYSDDILRHLKSVEQNRILFDISNEFISCRPYLVNVLKYFVKKYGLTNLTLHLSIYILDTFLSKNQISSNEMQLTAIACFLVAAKFEEEESKIPCLFQLNDIILDDANNRRHYTLLEYREKECRILQCTKFNLAVPTIATFANFFSRTSVILDDFHNYQRNCYEKSLAALSECNNETNSFEVPNIFSLFDNYEDMRTYVNNLLFQLVDVAVGILFFLNVLPSKTAAACLAAARLLYNIQPIWTVFLESQTEYMVSDVLPFAEMIVNLYEIHVFESVDNTAILSSVSSSNTDHNYSVPYNSILYVDGIPNKHNEKQ